MRIKYWAYLCTHTNVVFCSFGNNVPEIQTAGSPMCNTPNHAPKKHALIALCKYYIHSFLAFINILPVHRFAYGWCVYTHRLVIGLLFACK